MTKFCRCLMISIVTGLNLSACTVNKPSVAPETQQAPTTEPTQAEVPLRAPAPSLERPNDVPVVDSSQAPTKTPVQTNDRAQSAISSIPKSVEPPASSPTKVDSSKSNPALVKRAPLKVNLPPRPNIGTTAQTGALENRSLTEVSGLSASRDWPGVLYAINDSGNSATLYAMSETGRHLGEWTINGRNRDWEDLANVTLDGQNYVVIGDTGDNLQVHKKNTLYFVTEPAPGTPDDNPLEPDRTLNFVYEDGPRNVEAFAIHEKTIYLISKEPVSVAGTQASRLYSLAIPATQSSDTFIAKFVGTLAQPRQSLESKLAASLAGVDLDHPTALAIDSNGLSAYLLSYREVRRFDRLPSQTWEHAFQQKGRRIHFHQLGQAEALALAQDKTVFITSENRSAPIWAIPVK